MLLRLEDGEPPLVGLRLAILVVRGGDIRQVAGNGVQPRTLRHQGAGADIEMRGEPFRLLSLISGLQQPELAAEDGQGQVVPRLVLGHFGHLLFDADVALVVITECL